MVTILCFLVDSPLNLSAHVFCHLIVISKLRSSLIAQRVRTNVYSLIMLWISFCAQFHFYLTVQNLQFTRKIIGRTLTLVLQLMKDNEKKNVMTDK
jgi:hypothetical protein